MNIKVNETPVRTSRNFLINNIKIDNLELPKNVSKFENVDISSDKSIVSENTNISNLVYGNGDLLEENNLKYCNSKIQLETAKEDVKIVYNFDDKNISLINQIEIKADKDSTVYVIYNTKTEKNVFHNGIIKSVAKNGAKLNVVVVNFLNEQSYNFDSFEAIVEEDSKINFFVIDLGGKTSVVNYYSNLIGEKAINNVRGIYLGKDEEKKDLNIISHLNGKKSVVDIDIQGCLDDKSKKNFKGTIDFKNGCSGAKGSENEFCLLLSENAKSIALPMLLCTEDDVEGNHSTACGKVENDSLFYIMSRGIEYKEAIKLIVKSNFNKILDEIKDEELRNQIIEKIDSRLK